VDQIADRLDPQARQSAGPRRPDALEEAHRVIERKSLAQRLNGAVATVRVCGRTYGMMSFCPAFSTFGLGIWLRLAS
jgi:hypothetical protein